MSEGLALFWKKSRFSLLESLKIVLGESVKENENFSDFRAIVEANDELKESFYKRTTTLQLAVLEEKEERKEEEKEEGKRKEEGERIEEGERKEEGQRRKTEKKKQRKILVANTHLYFKPDADHIRLLQIGVISRHLELFKNKYQEQGKQEREREGREDKDKEEREEKDKEEQISILLCGDFNSCPKSGVPHFLENGHVSPDYDQWSSCPGQEVNNFSIRHPFQMGSACGYPKYTNFTLGFSDCLDYVFYEKNSLKVLEVVPFPAEEDLRPAIPNVTFPSDHLACVAKLKWL